MPQTIFNIIAKNDKIEHIPDNMPETAVQKLGSNQSNPFGKRRSRKRNRTRICELAGYKRPSVEKIFKLFGFQPQLNNKEDNICYNQRPRHPRRNANWIFVMYGNQGTPHLQQFVLTLVYLSYCWQQPLCQNQWIENLQTTLSTPIFIKFYEPGASESIKIWTGVI